MNFDDIQSEKSYKPFQVYGYTKLANILFTKKLSSILKDKKISVNCLHPGVVGTSFGQNNKVTILTKFYHLSLNHLCVLLKKVQKHLFIYVLRHNVSDISGEYFYNCRLFQKHQMGPKQKKMLYINYGI